MQSTLKNPMADSYTTGVSSGAAFGATLSIVAGFTLFSSQFGMLVNAFVFSLAPTAVIILVSKLRNVSSTSMILAGLAVMYIFNACTTVLKLWAEPDALASLYRWQVGSLNNMIWGNVPVMLAVTTIGSIAVLLLSNKINILSSGDESAKSLGVNAQNLRVICLAIVSLITASIVSFTGTIGFVGLVAPHIVRLFIGSDNRFLIPASGAFGALLLLVSDFIGRTVIAPAVLEVGVITAFIGGPMFLYLIIRQKREAWRWRSS
jgi:iron complex transport system permease protein